MWRIKKLWYITISYSHIESYKHLYRNHSKYRKEKCFLRHNIEVPEPRRLQYGIVYATIPETVTAFKHRDGAVFFGCSCPLLMAGGTPPETPLELSKASVPLQVRMMSPPLHFSGFLLSCYPSKVQYPCNVCHRSRGLAAGPTG